DQDRGGDVALAIAPGSAERGVGQAQLGQRLAAPELEVAGDVIALLLLGEAGAEGGGGPAERYQCDAEGSHAAQGRPEARYLSTAGAAVDDFRLLLGV